MFWIKDIYKKEDRNFLVNEFCLYPVPICFDLLKWQPTHKIVRNNGNGFILNPLNMT